MRKSGNISVGSVGCSMVHSAIIVNPHVGDPPSTSVYVIMCALPSDDFTN